MKKTHKLLIFLLLTGIAILGIALLARHRSLSGDGYYLPAEVISSQGAAPFSDRWTASSPQIMSIPSPGHIRMTFPIFSAWTRWEPRTRQTTGSWWSGSRLRGSPPLLLRRSLPTGPD